MSSVLIAGLSARAAADSAVAAGLDVTVVDAFADLDLHPSVRAVSLPRDVGVPFSADAAARAAAGLATDAVAYLANFENEPDAVAALAAGRTLWGNPPDVLRRARDPVLLANAMRGRGLPFARVRTNANENATANANESNAPNAWLLKPLASGGGRGIRPWAGDGIPRGYYVQERIEGVPGSVVFVAANGAAVPLGVSRQLIGEAAFGAHGYRYCGNILAPAADPVFDDGLLDSASAVASAVSTAFGLVGVNGVDFIAADGAAYPIEVNPRWSASLELVERAFGVSVFAAHAAACEQGALPAFELRQARHGAGALGKAILFARTAVTMGDTRPWLRDATLHDVPHPGERIAAGRPICSIVADGADAAGCHAALIRRAERMYAHLEDAAPLD